MLVGFSPAKISDFLFPLCSCFVHKVVFMNGSFGKQLSLHTMEEKNLGWEGLEMKKDQIHACNRFTLLEI
jgi:hypothetical protein